MDAESREVVSLVQLTKHERAFFREMFRKARERALCDAEGFSDVLYTLERFGARLKPNAKGMKDVRDRLLPWADQSPLATATPRTHRTYHTAVDALFKQMHF